MIKTRHIVPILLAALCGCSGDNGGSGASGSGTTSSSGPAGSGGMGGGEGGSGGGGMGGMGGAGGGDIAQPAGTSLFLQVFDTMGNAIQTAAVTVNGQTRPTDGAGQILYENLAPGRFVARVEAYGYAPASAVAELTDGAHGGMEVVLLPLSTPIPVDAGQWTTLGQTRVWIPPGSIVDENGEPVTGPVDATIVPLDPTKDIGLVPGPLEGIPSGGGDAVGLESVFMAEISLWQNGNRLQLKPGFQATIEFVLPDALAAQYQSGDVVPAWHFDLDEGIWKEEGSGTVGPSQLEPGKLVWTAQVGHFSWWNWDRPIIEEGCFEVLVTDADGVPVPNQRVTAQAIGYAGEGWSFTGKDGRTCLGARKGASVNLIVGPLAAPIYTEQVTSNNLKATCGAGCKQVTLKAIPPVCVPGSSTKCTYSGPMNTLGVGLCQAATSYCSAGGAKWLGCVGEVKPSPENCNTPFDEDCDGLVNEEGQGCNCTPGMKATCYTGPAGTIGVGPCKGGQRSCNLNGKGYGPCMGQVVPKQDVCATPEDDDCDGELSCYVAPLWSKKPGLPGWGKGQGVAVDTAGNVVVAGFADGSIDFGAGPVLPGAYADVLALKLDPAGNQLWAKGFNIDTPFSFNPQNEVALDGSDNVFVGGTFGGTVDFGGGSLVADGNGDVFLLKLGPTGNHLWSKRFGDMSSQGLLDMAVRSNGEIAIAGTFYGSPDFGGGPLASELRDGFVAKLDVSGNHVWSKRFGGPLYDGCASVAIDSSGNTVVVGGFQGTADLGGNSLTSAGNDDAYVVKLDATGNVMWSKRFGATAFDTAQWVVVDVAGAVIIGGTFSDVVDFGGGPLGIAGGKSPFLLKLDSTGNHVWSKSLSAQPYATDAAGNILVSRGGSVAWLDASGNQIWGRLVDGAEEDAAFDSMGNFVVTGFYKENVWVTKFAP